MTKFRIGFIGGGNMATSLIGGLIATGHPAAQILVAEPDEARRDKLESDHGVPALTDNAAVAAQADILVLAVKPKVIAAVLETIAEPAKVRKPVVISIAAGVRLDSIAAAFDGAVSCVRAMPNTPALIRAGITGVYAGPGLGEEKKRMVTAVLSAVGQVRWFAAESELDAVTALSGSGPAYFFYLMEALQAAGQALGLPDEDVRALVLETALGAAKLALKSESSPAELRRQVTSPGGTTQAALEVFDNREVAAAVGDAVLAAARRAAELAQG